MKIHKRTIRLKRTSMEIMNKIMVEVFEAIATQSGELCKHSNIKVLSEKSIGCAVRILFPQEMAKAASDMGNEAVLRFKTKD